MSGDRELMRFYDGELSPAEQALVRQRLERDAGARSKLRALEQTGELVRDWAEARSEGFDVADQVMTRLESASLAEGERPQTRPSASLAEGERPRTLRRSRLLELWLPAAAAVALAAAVLLLVIGRSAPVSFVGGAPAPPFDRPAAGSALSPLAPKTAAILPVREPSVAIESVDFGEKQGTIFMVGGESGETPVIWLSDPAPSRMPL